MSPIERLEARKAEIQTRLTEIPDLAESEERSVTDEESTEIDALVAEFRAANTKIASLNAAAEARKVVAAGAVPTSPVLGTAATTELRTEPYHRKRSDSYFADMLRVKQGDTEARERLVTNNRYVASRESRAETTVAGAGGEWAPPLWLESQWIKYLRAGRVFADRLNKVDLPKGVSSINLPKLTGGTVVAAQGTQNTAVNQQDVTTSSVSTGITTLAGGATISLQLIEQSPISIDEVILKDLAQDLAKRVDLAAITAVAAVSGLNAITYTSASPTSAAVTQYVQQGIDQVNNAIFQAPNTIVMRPERWGKMIAAADGQGRPLVLPSAAYGPYNALGLADGQTAQGYAGNLRGVDVYLDANIPVNLGAGTNQDEIFILKADEISLYESVPQFETFEQTYATNAAIFCRAIEYYGIIPNRYPGAISLITGTGMVSTLAYGS